TSAARSRRGLVTVGTARAARPAATGAWPVTAGAPVTAPATGPPAEVLLLLGGEAGPGPLGGRQLSGHVGGDVGGGVAPGRGVVGLRRLGHAQSEGLVDQA